MLLTLSGPQYIRSLARLIFGVALVFPLACSLTNTKRIDSGLQRKVVQERHAEPQGELRQWHEISLDLLGPFAAETGSAKNPFTDYRMTVTFEHESGAPVYHVPGYFAADGNAAETGATSGRVWRAHLSPDKVGEWLWRVRFVEGPGVAISSDAGTPLRSLDGQHGRFRVSPTDKTGRDFRAKGRLEYVGRHHLRFAGSGGYFLKAGTDAPETLLAYVDFDGTQTNKPEKGPLKTWQPHVRDWRTGDPSWRGDRGKGLIGAINYLAEKGLNALSFLPYNAGGDGDNVWPFVERDDKWHYDVSKLDQWGTVFAHAQHRGLFLHFKLQETENDDLRQRRERTPIEMPQALDGGRMGPERRLYLRELIARFGHHLALNWNLGEESTQSSEEQRLMAAYIEQNDPYGHPIVLHTYPNEQELVYEPLLGQASALTGVSLQNDWNRTHERSVLWIKKSAETGKPWVVANDEQGPASLGVPPDPGYEGFDGRGVDEEKSHAYDLHDTRRYTLWGNLMAGGAGVEYYFGYELPQNDLLAEDFRSRDRSWDFCRHALQFFQREKIPFWDMHTADELVGNPEHNNSVYALAKPGVIYLVYLPQGGEAHIDLEQVAGEFDLAWYNPRDGGPLVYPSRVVGDQRVSLKAPSADDWLAVIRRAPLPPESPPS
ncbi:MAG: DUF5060 domain-containing protein [Myxococcales bacterium]|nr:DUF5060 domain-containing protein [Myxococcales bacterium]